MPVRAHVLIRSIGTIGFAFGWGFASLAQVPSYTAGVVPDDMLTLVVGTRFVTVPDDDASARTLFMDARIPAGSFNDTDRCIDQSALEVAQDYFATLGRMLGKAGHYYFIPESEIKKAAAMCERMHSLPPQALVGANTTVIAFGRVVPTPEAASLEQSIR